MKVFAILIFISSFLAVPAFSQKYNDAALERVINDDKSANITTRSADLLPAATYIYRADVYMANRHFPEARAHWKKVLENYPNDPGIPKTLFGIARSYMWERNYEQAIAYFDKLIKDFPATDEGRNGLNFKGASFVRWGKNAEAVDVYKQYAVMFPSGEKIDSAYLNIIDCLRETGKYDEANQWVEKAVERFKGTPVEVNAVHARLRMEIYRQNWPGAIAAADALISLGDYSGSMVWADEVKYLKAFSLENAGRKAEARTVYLSIPNTATSFYGGLATERLSGLELKDGAGQRFKYTSSVASGKYPVMYQALLVKAARAKNIDPRFLLAIMMQESSFRARAKSPAAARGLLQLVFDTALKYSKQSGYPSLRPDDLYDPATNIAIGTAYTAELKNRFGGLYEAIAVSYNGGEDNAARWLARSRPKDAGVFVSEVGFKESKDYVIKVMSNFRAYRELYNEDLTRK